MPAVRRLLRILFNVAATVSLLLFVATCVLWVATQSRVTSMSVLLPRPRINVLAMHAGRFHFLTDDSFFVPPSDANLQPRFNYWYEKASGSIFYIWEAFKPVAGFSYVWLGSRLIASVPAWSVALVLAILPTARAIEVIRVRRRIKQELAGLCPSCGYDLRATPDRCPECGHVPAAG